MSTIKQLPTWPHQHSILNQKWHFEQTVVVLHPLPGNGNGIGIETEFTEA
jgi:hypothetical protein